MFGHFSSCARRVAIIGLWTVTIMCALGSKWRDEGVAPFGYVMVALNDVEPDSVSLFSVWVRGSYADSARAVARIHLPSGVELVAGDTVHVGSALDSTGTWGVAPRFPDTVAVELRGDVLIHGASGVVDEGTFRFMIIPGMTRMHAHSEVVREEQVTQGQRYRYGGKYLVPISGPQEVTQRLLSARGERRRSVDPALEMRPSRGGGTADPGVLRVVVFVNGEGRPLDARIVDGKGISAELRERALRSAMAGRYQAARYRGSPVNDWIEVGVELK